MKNIIKIVSVIILVIIVVIAILSRKTTKVESPKVETTTKVTTTVAETTIATTTTPVTTTTITELVTTLEETTITEAITEKLIQETAYIEPKVAAPVTQIEVTIPVVPVTDAPVTDAPAVTQEIINPPANNTVDYSNMTSLGSLKITGYVATGNKTASGVYPYVGGCAMSRSHGIPFGSTVYVEGLGYYTVNDTGCAYGVVDIFCSTVQECYNLTGNYNVYLVN